MVSEIHRRSKEPATPLAGTYGHPIHPILVTVPIGAWFTSLIFDIASHWVRDSFFLVRASLWLIGIGIVAALAAALFGLMDLSRVAPGTRAFRIGLTHAALNVTTVLLYVISFALRWNHPALRSVPTGLVVLNAVSFAILSVSGFLGGMLSYRYGVRVADETVQSQGFEQRTDRDSYEGRRVPTGS